MAELPSLGLYIHIPWCLRKCPYCDFNSHTHEGTIPEEEYVDQLLADLSSDLLRVPNRTIKTIFIGGGTPSLMSVKALSRLLGGVRSLVPVVPDAEVTLEANPGTVEAERFFGYQEAGVNRISIGVQSFQAEKLHALGRIHDGEEARCAAELASRMKLRSINIDLMHGLPHQTVEQALADLRQAIDLGVPHLSWYQLTLEPHTMFASRPPPMPTEERLWEIFDAGVKLITSSGYQQYEISAYSQTGHRCQHNLNYWNFGDYLGIGCGAHGKITMPSGEIIRTSKTKHPRGYLGGSHLHSAQNVPPEQRPLEFFMNLWRLNSPTPRQLFSQRTGVSEEVIRPILERLILEGHLIESPEAWRLTQRARLFLNNILERFIP